MTNQATAPSTANWYIIHTYSGQEERVKKNLELRIESMDAKDKVFQVVIPTEKEIEIKDGKRKPVQRKVFPGYILVQMVMDERSWEVVRETPGVTGFVSAEDENDRRQRPVPLAEKEVEAIMARMEDESPRIRVGLQEGQMVRITSGAFLRFHGLRRVGRPGQGEGARSRLLLRARDAGRAGLPPG